MIDIQTSMLHLLYIVRCLCLWSAGSSTLAEGDALNALTHVNLMWGSRALESKASPHPSAYGKVT